MKAWFLPAESESLTHSDNHHDASRLCQSAVRGYQAETGSEGDRVVDAYRTQAIDPVILGTVRFGTFLIPSERGRRNLQPLWGDLADSRPKPSHVVQAHHGNAPESYRTSAVVWEQCASF